MNNFGKFPSLRLRRTRQHEWSRRLVSETHLSVNDLVLPLFVIEGKNKTSSVESMPGVNRYSIDLLVKQVKKAENLGIPAVALFPSVEKSKKTLNAEESFKKNNLICRAISEIKNKDLNIGIITDVALDPYTTHGHDGIVKNGIVANDETIDVLCKQALVQVEAGADIVAPSDMMDGRIKSIRDYLDSEGFINTQILSYAAKYASSFYGPFRDAVGSIKNLGKADKKTYQMDPRNSSEGIREIAMDIDEGADMIIVKPGMPYLDIIQRASTEFNIPIFAYQVSGEYSMIKAAGNNMWIDSEKAMLESLIAFKRAGCTGIFTYSAMEIAKSLNMK